MTADVRNGATPPSAVSKAFFKAFSDFDRSFPDNLSAFTPTTIRGMSRSTSHVSIVLSSSDGSWRASTSTIESAIASRRRSRKPSTIGPHCARMLLGALA